MGAYVDASDYPRTEEGLREAVQSAGHRAVLATRAYTLSRPLELARKTLIGPTSEPLVLVAGPDWQGDAVLHVTAGPSELRGVTLDAAGRAPYALRVDKAHGTTGSQVVCMGAIHAGAFLDYHMSGHWSDCRFRSNETDGLWLSGCNGTTLDRCSATSNGGAGILAHGGSHLPMSRWQSMRRAMGGVVIRACTLEGNDGWGLIVTADGTEVTGCWLEGNGGQGKGTRDGYPVPRGAGVWIRGGQRTRLSGQRCSTRLRYTGRCWYSSIDTWCMQGSPIHDCAVEVGPDVQPADIAGLHNALVCDPQRFRGDPAKLIRLDEPV